MRVRPRNLSALALATLALAVASAAKAQAVSPGNYQCLFTTLEILRLDEQIEAERARLQRSLKAKYEPFSGKPRTGPVAEPDRIAALKAKREKLADALSAPAALRSAARKAGQDAPPIFHDDLEIPRDWSETVTGLQYVEQGLTPEERALIQASPIGLIDGNSHALKVGRVLAPARSSVQRTVQYSGDGPKGHPAQSVDINSGLDHFLSQERPPSVINLSMAGAISREKVRQLAERGVLVVKSGGNFDRGKFPTELKSGEAGDFMIAAGATNSAGLTSLDETIPGPHIATNALGAAVYSDPALSPTTINMTSSAAPQVARALANVKALLPGLTLEQARILLARTNLRGVDRRAPDGFVRGEAGLLNAWKAWKVARRLKALPPGDWDDALRSERLYDFGTEKDALVAEAEGKAPKDRYRLLQKAFLLGPTPEIARAITATLEAFPRRYPVMELFYLHYFSNAPLASLHVPRLIREHPSLRVPLLLSAMRQRRSYGVDSALDACMELDFAPEERRQLLEALETFISGYSVPDRGRPGLEKATALRKKLEAGATAPSRP